MLHASQNRQTNTASKAYIQMLGCHQQSCVWSSSVHQHKQPKGWGADLKGAGIQAPCPLVTVAKALMMLSFNLYAANKI